MIAAVKALALTLGRTPTRVEFESSIRGGAYKLSKLGGYTAILQAAGLDTYDDRRSRKITNAIFNAPIEAHLSALPAATAVKPLSIPTAAIISDIHWPFHCQRVVDAFIEYVGDEKPEFVIINGDAWDMYSHAKFPRSHNIFTPREEQESARARNVAFWDAVKKASPKSKCVQTLGNHDVRPLKRVLEAYPEAEDWIAQKMRELFTFDGVETIHDPRQEVMLNAHTAVFHGYRSQLGSHRDFTLMNCVNGHTHRGGVVFRNIGGVVRWELNSGYAGDPLAKGLTYTAQRITDWTHGFGAIDKRGPRFIPA